MKNILKRLFIGGCVAFTISTIIIGCATANPQAGQPILGTNSAGQVVTNGVQPAYNPNPTGMAIVSTASQINAAVPSPWAVPIGAGLALATTIMTFIAKQQNNKAAAAVNANTQTTAQLNAVIQGVEQGTSGSTVTAATVKQAIQSRATAAGVQPALDAKVQSLTA